MFISTNVFVAFAFCKEAFFPRAGVVDQIKKPARFQAGHFPGAVVCFNSESTRSQAVFGSSGLIQPVAKRLQCGRLPGCWFGPRVSGPRLGFRLPTAWHIWRCTQIFQYRWCDDAVWLAACAGAFSFFERWQVSIRVVGDAYFQSLPVAVLVVLSFRDAKKLTLAVSMSSLE